jgi:hypothetical protein
LGSRQQVANGAPQLLNVKADIQVEEMLLQYLITAQAPQVLGLAVPGADFHLGAQHRHR